MNVLGLDLSTTRTGVAYQGRTSSIVSPKIPTHAGTEDKARRLHYIIAELDRTLRRWPPKPDVAVIEGYSLGSPGRWSLIALGELGGAIRVHLFEIDIPFVVIEPTALKRYATGSGSASKDQMVAASRDLGYTPDNHDEADASILEHLGLAAAGVADIGRELRDSRLDVIASHRWPTTRRTTT